MPSSPQGQMKMDSHENLDDDDTMIGRIVLTPCLRIKQKAGKTDGRVTIPTRRTKPTTGNTTNCRGSSKRLAHPLEGRDDGGDDDEEEETIYFYTATSSSTRSSDDSERENDLRDSNPNPKKVMFDENHKEITYYTDEEEQYATNTRNESVVVEKREPNEQERSKPTKPNCCCSGIGYLLSNLFTRWTGTTTTNNNEVRIDPNLYLQATGEIWVSILIICWFLIAINNPDSITTDNPYLDRLGYINLWIGWDLALLSPSEEGGAIPSALTALGLVGWIVCTSCGMRFCYLDTIRTALHSHRNNRVQYVIKRTCHGLFIMSLCSKMWFLSITSVFHNIDLIQQGTDSDDEDNNDVDNIRKIVWSTTCMNMGLMFTWYLIVMSTYLEHHKEYQDQTKCKIFLIVFGICSFAVPPLILYQYFVYDFRYHPSSQTILPIHPGLLAPLDYLWYVCMLLTNRFLLPKENHRLILIQSYSLIQKEPVTASSTTSTTAETNTLSTTTAAEF